MTYSAARAFPDLYRRALEDWQSDCPGALPIGSFELSEERPHAGCENWLHFWEITPEERAYVMFTDRSGRILGTTFAMAPEPSYALILFMTGWALGFADMPTGSGSIMEGPSDGATALTQLDREGFCAMYANGGYCGD